MRKRQFLIVFAALLAASAASAQVGNAFWLATASMYGGVPDCRYRTWGQCRVSQPGAGVYCYMNTKAGYIFDTRDPANPRVIGLKPLRKPQTRH
jgi:hypothetical protein